MRLAWTAIFFAARLWAQSTTTITAHIQLEDGSPINASPLVVPSPGNEFLCHITSVFRDGTIQIEVYTNSPYSGEVQVPECSLMKVALAGYRPFSGIIRDGSVITLHRLREREGSSVSISTINAPRAARKAYEKGEDAMSRQKWAQAEKSFLQAVALYPAYAPAWSELGSALEQQGDLDPAAAALRKASAADPAYVKPLVQLAAVMEKLERWDEELAASEHALQLHPIEFPNAYYYNAEAKYRLGRYEQAEAAARDAIERDQHSECLRSHILLGMVLAQRGDNHAAAREFRLFLKLDPKSPDAGTAKSELAKLAL